ncbi:hypothetical protein HMN09_00482600 [Mycena chlorophos]|uniref:Uncharacterized protein n=1 Tax=Mycena chlorophos TaxID=658473 RepID=A0A8H6WM67_MYCCL|nr:hypothetical protein HMN09_00482600 [Mycena chlorophos]
MKFTYGGKQYPCALVHWFSAHGDVVHLDAMLRAVHLVGVAGKEFLPPDAKDLDYYDSLDAFNAFYVNKLSQPLSGIQSASPSAKCTKWDTPSDIFLWQKSHSVDNPTQANAAACPG